MYEGNRSRTRKWMACHTAAQCGSGGAERSRSSSRRFREHQSIRNDRSDHELLARAPYLSKVPYSSVTRNHGPLQILASPSIVMAKPRTHGAFGTLLENTP